jgi:hypothetical protein
MNISKLVFFVILMLSFSVCYSQKGANDQYGIARLRQSIAIEKLEVEILKIVEGPCENTMGRSDSGTHLIVRNMADGKQLNIHLGPTNQMQTLVALLPPGKKISAEVFRTPKLAEDQYISKELVIDDLVYEIRDQDLRPFWAGVW